MARPDREMDKKIKTALKYAANKGCLIIDSFGMKSISAESGAGSKRIASLFKSKHRSNIIGFYKITDKFPEEIVEKYMREDLIYTKLI